MGFEVRCDSCDSRFALPDGLFERKVKGRLVTIKCKKCGAGIMVDGSVSPIPEPAISEGDGGTPTVPLEVRATGAKKDDLEPTPTVPLQVGGDVWLVSFADDDDRELTSSQITEALTKGDIDTDTIVWRDGMDDWLPIAEVEPLRGAVSAAKKRAPPPQTGGFLGTGMKLGKQQNVATQPTPADEEEEAPISIEPESLDPESLKALQEKDSPAAVALAPGTLGSPKPPEVKKPPPRRSPPTPKAEAKSPKLPAPKKREPVTQKRDETASKKPEPERPKPPTPKKATARKGHDAATATSAAPALRSLSKSEERADEDIFGLGGGGGIVAPPDVDAPIGPPTIDLSDLSGPPSSSKKKKKKKKKKKSASGAAEGTAPAGIAEPDKREPEPILAPPPAAKREAEEKRFPVVWVVVAAAVILGGAYLLFIRPKSDVVPAEPEVAKAPPRPTAPSRTATPPEPEPGASAPEPPPGPAEEPTATPSTRAPSTQHATASKPAAPGAKPGAKPPAQPPEATEPPEKKPPEKKPEEKPKEVAMGGAFDKGAARAALASAAGQASGCRKPSDPSGRARVTVTFAPSGRVTSAVVSGPPFAGTATGGCIASTMRRARVPPFGGSPVTVGKTVVIR